MKTALFIILLVLSLARHACASGSPAITITTADTGVSYRLVDPNFRNDKDAKTLDEVEAWIVEALKHEPKLAHRIVLVFTDDRTTFATVLDLLLRFKTARVGSFTVGRNYSSEGVEGVDYISGAPEKIHSSRSTRRPAKN